MGILALIPARGGSKGVPGKNIKKLRGKPLIQWSISYALKFPVITRIIVSTDSLEIADIAKKCGAEVPFIRPHEFAMDDTPDRPVYLHTLSWLKENEGYVPDVMIILRPTSPLRVREDMETVLHKIKDKNVDSVRTVKYVKEHPYWMYQKDEKGRAAQFVAGVDFTKYYQRQLLPDVFFVNGVLDAIRPHVVKSCKNPYGKNMYLVATDSERSIDFDNEEDFLLAEFYLTKHNIEKHIF